MLTSKRLLQAAYLTYLSPSPLQRGGTMRLIHRQTQLEDLPSCLDLLKGSPAYSLELLDLWKELITNNQANSAVVEDRSTSRAKIVGFGITIFVTDTFMATIRQGTSPLLPVRFIELRKTQLLPALNLNQIRKANQKDGLNLLGLHSCWGLPGMPDSECAPIRDKMLESLFANHRGYNIKTFCKEIYGEAERSRHLLFGFKELNSYGRYRLQDSELLTTEVLHPFLIGMSREEAMQPAYEGRLIREFFKYTPPLCSFTPADQALLQLASVGLNESTVARILSISKESVKSRWDSVYSHIPRQLDHELFDNSGSSFKSRILLNWLKHHPEEIMPRVFFPGVNLISDHSSGV